MVHKKLKVIGYPYQVIESSSGFDDFGCFARCNSEKLRFTLANGLCDEQKISTIIHEIIEALSYHMGLDLEHPIIMALETGIYAVLTENGIDLTPLLGVIVRDEST